MPFVFIDDGNPEAADYENNYVYFEPHKPSLIKELFAWFNRLIAREEDIEVHNAHSDSSSSRGSSETAHLLDLREG